MNERLNIQDLMDLLAEKHGMNKKDADSFVKEFFLLIEESLERDRYVKIKGLGTFKLIDVDNRESVNVNTGERFQIQGHAKISFTPEPTLKEIINRPFSHFETVALNDNTVLENTPLENGNEYEEEENVDLKESEENVQSAKATNEPPIAIMPQEPIIPEQKISGKPIDEESVEDVEETVEEQKEMPADSQHRVKEVESPGLPQEKVPAPEQPELVKKETADASTMRYFIGIVVFVILLCGGAIVFMYYPDLLDQSTSKPVVEKGVEAKKDEPVNKAVPTDSLLMNNNKETVKTDTVTESLTVSSTSKETPKEEVTQSIPAKETKKAVAESLKPDSVEYTIAGTETTYTIQEGESLTKVALRFYGTKALWPYLVKHNPGVIKNPDNVPFGTTIKIPKLVKKQ